MQVLRNILCNLFGICYTDYNKKTDPLFLKYAELDHRVDNLEYKVDRMWKPRDLLDIR